VTGILFYYGTEPFRRMHSVRAFVTTGGETDNGSTKILWWFRRGAAGTAVEIRGTRLDGDATFSDRYPTRVAGPAFPSYLVVPEPGCWRVTVRSGPTSATFVFRAFRARAAS
jgi:hypothetical protein